jgi:integrase
VRYVTLGQKDAVERIVYGREPEKLPPFLSSDELSRFLEAVRGLRNRVALTTSYAAGLRINEVARLKVTSIDSARMLIHVENGTPLRRAELPASAATSSDARIAAKCALPITHVL